MNDEVFNKTITVWTLVFVNFIAVFIVTISTTAISNLRPLTIIIRFDKTKTRRTTHKHHHQDKTEK